MCDTFPTDTCVLVCSGPSLNLVNPFELGLPVVVISTAIRKITNPHYWILADHLNEMHGQQGNVAYQNENIVKIVPTGKISGKHRSDLRTYCEFDYTSSDNHITDKNNHLFSGKLPFLRGPHKTVTFGVQWLYHVGVRNIIWVGNDLHAKSATEKYAYESNETDLKKAYNYNVTIDQVHETLKSWYDIAKTRNLGFNWYSWKCGEIFEKFVPAFDYDSYVKPESSIYFEPVKDSSEPVNDIQPLVHVKKKEKVITKTIENRSKNRPPAPVSRPTVIKSAIKRTEIPVIKPVPQPQPIIQVKQELPKPPPVKPKSNIVYPKYKKIPAGDPQISIKRIKDSLK